MIETLHSETAPTRQEDPLAPVLTITGITFEDGDLSRPRYGSLIDQDRAPTGVQFEPCLQIRQGPVGDLGIVFEISEEDVEFALNDLGEVAVSSILDPQNFQPPGLVSAKLVSGNAKKCELIWRQADADSKGVGRLSTLRLHCKPQVVRPLTAVEEVEGGLYLSFLNHPEAPPNETGTNPPGDLLPGTIKVLGLDGSGRPVYDLFDPEVLPTLPQALVLEPAFRCREGQIVAFSLLLDTPLDLEFVTEEEPNQGQVAVLGYVPEGYPFQLYQTAIGENGDAKKCSLEWFQETGRQHCATSNPEEAKRCYCIRGQNSSFGLRIKPAGMPLPVAIAEGKVAEIDPTVIQPPNCTSSGICITP